MARDPDAIPKHDPLVADRLAQAVEQLRAEHPTGDITIRVQKLPDRESIQDTWFDLQTGGTVAMAADHFVRLGAAKLQVRATLPWREVEL